MSEKVNVPESGDRPVNTRRLQVFELNRFMINELHAVFDGVGFTDVEFNTQYSFDHAVKLFNERDDKDFGDYVVDTLKLRYCKGSKKILCTNHWIKVSKSFSDDCAEEGLEPFKAVLAVMNALRLR